jgi:hypothetical protein
MCWEAIQTLSYPGALMDFPGLLKDLQLDAQDMNIPGLLKDLQLDAWYMDLLYLGIIIFVTSLFVETRGITSGDLQLLSLGALLIGFGGWQNHELRLVIKPSSAPEADGPELVEKRVYSPSSLGIVLNICGGVLIAIGIAGAVF